MADQKPPKDQESNAPVGDFIDRSTSLSSVLSPGMGAVIQARNVGAFEELRDDLTGAIKESKSSHHEPGAVARAAVELADQEAAEQRMAEAIKAGKSTSNLVRSVNGAILRGARQAVRNGGFPTTPTQPGETPTHASTLDKYLSADPPASTSTQEPSRGVRIRYDADPTPKAMRTDLPLWAKWAFGIAGVVGVTLAAIRLLVG